VSLKDVCWKNGGGDTETGIVELEQKLEQDPHDPEFRKLLREELQYRVIRRTARMKKRLFTVEEAAQKLYETSFPGKHALTYMLTDANISYSGITRKDNSAKRVS
jgi:hypothetical protein